MIRGRLAPEVGDLLLRALDAVRETLGQRRREAGPPPADPVAEAPTRAQQQADTLALLAETALHHELDPGAPGERYQVVVHVDAAVLADPSRPGQSELHEGGHVSAETSRRLACDAGRVVMRHDADGQMVEVGARTRTIPRALRRALPHRDRTCRFPACHVRIGQGHHVRHWANGGPTTLSNLVLLCRGHHRAVHEGGYQVERSEDGALHVRSPDGRPLPEVPLPITVPIDPNRGAARVEQGAWSSASRANGLPAVAGRARGRGLGDRRAAPARYGRGATISAVTRRAMRWSERSWVVQPAVSSRGQHMRDRGLLRMSLSHERVAAGPSLARSSISGRVALAQRRKAFVSARHDGKDAARGQP